MITNYICDICGKSFNSLQAVTDHLRQDHDVEQPVPKGKIDQSQPGKLILQHEGEEPITIDLDTWVKQHLPSMPRPSIEELQQWQDEGFCYATDGCVVEPDGECEHGHPSWLLYLGMI